jgi:DNA-binding beta-propeller fold protein YncE
VDGAEVKTITVGTDPLYMTWIYTRGLLAVANSGDNSVSLVKDAAETARLDASNSADMKRPYGIHSWDGSRLIVSNHDADYATWWNLRMNATGDTAADLVISSSHITTGTGVTAIDGDYIP